MAEGVLLEPVLGRLILVGVDEGESKSDDLRLFLWDVKSTAEFLL